VTWAVRLEDAAQRELEALDGPIRSRVVRAIARLALDPYNTPNATALRGGGYRLRVGDWRVLYDIRSSDLIVVVVRVGHRREVYR